MTINAAYHKFLQDENRAMRDLLRKLYQERQWMQCELLDLRDSLRSLERQEALSFKGSGVLTHKSLINHTHQ